MAASKPDRTTPEMRVASRADDAGAHRTRLMLISLAGIAALGAFATLFAVWYRTKTPESNDILRIALDEYAAGRFELAGQLSERVAAQPEDTPDERLRMYLLGASGIQMARQASDPQTMRLRIAQSAPYLQRLVVAGFPPGRLAEGQRLLGIAMKSSGRYDEAIAPLEGAIAADPTFARKLLLSLAEARLRANVPDVERALRDVQSYLDLPNLTSEAKDDAAILRARMLAKSHQWDEAEQVLRGISDPRRRDQVDMAMARLFIDRARWIADNQALGATQVPADAKVASSDAIALLEGVYHRNEGEYGAAALYLMGLAHRAAGRHDEALGILASLRQNIRQPAEAVAAGIEEVELLTQDGHYDDAVSAARAIIRDVGDPVTFDPKWLSLADFRDRLEAIAEMMRGKEAFTQSIEFAKSLPPIMAPGDALMLEAQSHRRWGESLLAQAKTGSAQFAPQARSEARAHFRDAGASYAAVAKLRFDQAEYVDLLWEAIDAYQSGRAYEQSLDLLDDYLRYERRPSRPRGLIAKGRALLATGDAEEALIPLEDCIAEYPRDPLRYEARLLAAIARSGLGQVDEPRQHLEENLFDGRLSPESPLFRDSLFVLGELLYRRALREYLDLTAPTLAGGRLSEGDQPKPEAVERFHQNQEVLEDAISKLEEAAYRDRIFDNLPRSHRASYLAAEAHRLAAFWPAIQASDPETLESARRQLNQQRLAHLVAARDTFASLRKSLLDHVGSRNELQPWEQSMLRNCFMGFADALFEMHEPELAADAYQQASQEFLNEPLALEALLQQARCYDQLGKEADAKRIYQQAAKVLQRIPEEENGRFVQTTRYDRADWQALLEWLQQT